MSAKSVTLHLISFYGQTKEILIPKLLVNKPLSDLLEVIFYIDYQVISDLPSLSMMDIIELDDKYYLITNNGFCLLSNEEFLHMKNRVFK